MKLFNVLLVPLAFCASVPITNHYNEYDKSLAPALQYPTESLAIPNLGEEFSNFLTRSLRIADDSLSKYENKANIPNWPNNMNDLVKLADSYFKTQRADVATKSDNPIQDLINMIFGAINQITNTIGYIFSAINQVASTTNEVAGQISYNITIGGSQNNYEENITPPPFNTFDGVFGVINDTISNIMSDLMSEIVKNGIPGLISSITSNTSIPIEDLTDGVITAEILNNTLGFIEESYRDVNTGKKDIVQVVNEGLDKIVDLTAANNPLGKFIQKVAVYLSYHPDGLVANTIKVGTFLSAITDAIVAVLQKVFANISEGAIKGISTAVQNAFDKIVVEGHLGLNYTQQIYSDGVFPLEKRFENSMRAQDATVTSLYIQVLIDIIDKVAPKLLVSDPFVFAVFADPSENNIRRFVLDIAKIITDNNGN